MHPTILKKILIALVSVEQIQLIKSSNKMLNILYNKKLSSEYIQCI